jgi:4-hydroxy-3-polyprenylbenzoate decarboxylase
MLEQTGDLARIKVPIDPHLEMAEIQRRAYRQGGPALLFENVVGSPFSCVSNLFGTSERTHRIFAKNLPQVRRAVQIKADLAAFLRQAPKDFLKDPMGYLRLPWAGLTSLPNYIPPHRAPVLECSTSIDKLPAIKSWPDDGGPFITLPQVLSLDPTNKSILKSNMGMYRIQMSGNDYIPNEEIGLHYQIHRGLGIHHTAAQKMGQTLKVSIFVGGHPAHTVAAVMPLPEGLSELIFAGMLAGHRFRYTMVHGFLVSADADFCILGEITDPKPEGPFGDHLGYYSLKHPFPTLKVKHVYHRRDAIWPFTVVGRPPQEDTSFGEFIHDITGPMVPVSLPGVKELHAVDAAGVHPLLLALGTERYTPFLDLKRPQELLTQAHSILGFNQCSLAKYLLILNHQDQPGLSATNIPLFFQSLLERVDLKNDLHFHTKTTIDTLDYSGEGFNQGSKLVIAAVGPKRRSLCHRLPPLDLPSPWRRPLLVMPGVLAIEGPKFSSYDSDDVQQLVESLGHTLGRSLDNTGIVWVSLCDESEFCASSLENFLWVTFTRSNPSHDCYGVHSFTRFKHWGCEGPLVVDARLKPHHAPPLVEDPRVTQKVDEMCAAGGPLNGIIK